MHLSDVVAGSNQRDEMDLYLKQVSRIGMADSPPGLEHVLPSTGCFDFSWATVVAFGAGLGVGYYILGNRLG